MSNQVRQNIYFKLHGQKGPTDRIEKCPQQEEQPFSEIIGHAGLLAHLIEAKYANSVGNRDNPREAGSDKRADTKGSPTWSLKFWT